MRGEGGWNGDGAGFVGDIETAAGTGEGGARLRVEEMEDGC